MKKIKKSFIIKGLKKNSIFKDAANIIMSFKLNLLIDNINEYLKNDNIDNLHDLRISVRRARYTLENFYNCFGKGLYLKLYNALSDLQDALGEIRDLDVMNEKLDYFEKNYGIEIPLKLVEEMKNKKHNFKLNTNKKLREFLSSKFLNKFHINKRGE